MTGRLTCVEIVDVTHDVKSFSFEVPDRAVLRFLPGQYLTLRLLIHGRWVERCYTISSAPTRPGQLTITVKRVPGGMVSNWLHDHVAVGDEVSACGPSGQFSFAAHPGNRYLFLTAGSGITPAMSMLRTLRDLQDPADVVFVHCARTPDDIIFRDELEVLGRMAGVSMVILCETESATETWHGPTGRLTVETLLRAAPELGDSEVFTCGPAPFMEAVRRHLDVLGADPRRCHEESFVLGGEVTAPPGAGVAMGHTTEGTAAAYRIGFRRSDRSVQCDAHTTILEAARRAGIRLLSSCEEGVCGTCKLALLAGAVDMQHAGGIRPREIAQGKILPCCSTPLEDLEVDA